MAHHSIYSFTPKKRWHSCSEKLQAHIALLNIMYKLYISCTNSFLSDYLLRNNIIAPEQASGKEGLWGTTKQLLINKSILNDARKHHQNLITVWLDYREAFDSVPHTWLIQALKLAKVLQKVVNAIETLMNRWYTILTIHKQSRWINDNWDNYILKKDFPRW